MKEKISVVTGGSSGLGLSIASELVKQKKNIVIIGRTEERLSNAIEMINQDDNGSVVKAFQMDVSESASVKRFFHQLHQEYEVECLYNVAGVGVFGQAKTVEEESLDAMINSNLKGLILMTSELLKYMESYGGKIANIMSTAGIKGKANESAYCATKWGARGFTEALKAEYKGRNILVYGVYPGGMKTNFWSSSPSMEVSDFMNPAYVAACIVENVLNEGLYVSDIVIERH